MNILLWAFMLALTNIAGGPVTRSGGAVTARIEVTENSDAIISAEIITTETVELDGKAFTAFFMGGRNISSFGVDYIRVEIWWLDGAFGELADNPRTGDVLPYAIYPHVEDGQAFKVVYIDEEGNRTPAYYIANGEMWNGSPATSGVMVNLPVYSGAVFGEPELNPVEVSGEIALYGEYHGVESILEQEFKLWYDYYHNEGMRHLFIEVGHASGELLNVWMKADSDELLDTWFDEIAGTQGSTTANKAFYKRIKEECPETVFHATDVDHQYLSTGLRYLDYLESKGLGNSEEYALALDMMEQAKLAGIEKNKPGSIFREQQMAANFIREFDNISGEKVMGIHGGAHVTFEGAADGTEDYPTMAAMLQTRYGSAVSSRQLLRDTEALRTETIAVAGKEYTASYYGSEDISSFTSFQSREFRRLEDAYDDFRDKPLSGDVLPYNNFPMTVEEGQVFVIDYTTASGEIIRAFYISNGGEYNGRPTTVGVLAE